MVLIFVVLSDLQNQWHCFIFLPLFASLITLPIWALENFVATERWHALIKKNVLMKWTNFPVSRDAPCHCFYLDIRLSHLFYECFYFFSSCWYLKSNYQLKSLFRYCQIVVSYFISPLVALVVSLSLLRFLSYGQSSWFWHIQDFIISLEYWS